MKDGLARRAVKGVALVGFVVTTGLDRLLARAFGRRPYRLAGDCRACGACCESPSIRVGWLTWYFPLWRRLFLAWHAGINGFVLRQADRAERTFVFRCTHFDPVGRRCDSYASRPGMCRDYPRVQLWAEPPQMLPGCGYRPVARGGKRMLDVLTQQPLTDAQREELKRRLFLE